MIFNLPPSFATNFLWNQLRPLPVLTADFTGQTVIVTGANVGLGLEAARHFAQLGASRVVLGCRSTERGEKARADIVASLSATPQAGAKVEMWPVDLTSFESVAHFCRRAATELDRLDAVVENAALATGVFEAADGGYESTIAVNVVSTFLMAVMLLPKMRETAARFNVLPRLAIVASDAHFFASFRERSQPRIFEAFKSPQLMSDDRYNVSKLLVVLLVRELAAALDASASSPTGGGGKPRVVVNALNPGFCRTQLFRRMPFPFDYVVALGLLLLGRTAEMGSRTLVVAAAAGEETQGKYMESCQLRDPSPYAMSEDGRKMGKKVYEELIEILEGIEPGVTGNI